MVSILCQGAFFGEHLAGTIFTGEHLDLHHNAAMQEIHLIKHVYLLSHYIGRLLIS